MRWLVVIAVCLGVETVPAAAQWNWLFTRSSASPPPAPEELIRCIRSCQKPEARVEAIQQLRNYNAAEYPAIIPALIDALKNDKAIFVRIEAARSLGRIRPITSAARQALATASIRDPAFRVRWQARTSLTLFTVRGINPYNYSSAESKPAQSHSVPDIEPGTEVPVEPPPAISGKGKTTGAADSPYARRLPPGPPAPTTPNVPQSGLPALQPIPQSQPTSQEPPLPAIPQVPGGPPLPPPPAP